MYISKLEAGLALGFSDFTIGRYMRREKLLLGKFYVSAVKV